MWALQLQLATYGTRTSFGPRGNYSQLRTLRVSVQRGLYSQLSRIIYTHTLNKHQPRVARIRKRVVTSQTMEASESNASKETYHEMHNTAYEKHHTIFRTSKFLILVRLLALIPIVLSMYLCPATGYLLPATVLPNTYYVLPATMSTCLLPSAYSTAHYLQYSLLLPAAADDDYTAYSLLPLYTATAYTAYTVVPRYRQRSSTALPSSAHRAYIL